MELKQTERLRLDARIVEQDEGRVQVQWTLVNDTGRTVIVLRHLVRDFDSKGRLKVEPDLVYVCVDEGGNIDIAKKMLRVPERGIQVFTPFVPLGEELAAGASISETITLCVPVASWNPYDEIIQSHTGFRAMKKVQSRTLRFHVGVYPQAPEAKSWTVETALGMLIFPNYDEVLAKQVIVDAPPISWTGEACA